MTGTLLRFGAALLLTAVLEAAAAWLLGLRHWRAQGVLALINAATNPALNLLLAALALLGIYSPASAFDPPVIALECAVAALEAWLLHAALALPRGRAALISVVCNAASYIAGAFII